ncbi:hypothetical protein BDV28DRAFT_151413 [Aspergillus coremiiformis]|uniref:Rhodopsin domain-containing protein n=1 Tax=Aspergillus coremiiformis TaxID=138285 RepID=A0A5N6YXS2_9EURO|nr:hypothetical protein BDV28DRAFT_151413 [Aspergillus coremiiformis]
MFSQNDKGLSSFAVTPDNHAAFIVIAALVGVIWSIFIIGIRIYLRLRLTPPLGLDDAVAVFGTIVGVAQTSITLHAVFHGIGTREDLLNPTRVEAGLIDIYIAWLLYPIAVCSSNVSLALLIARLTIAKSELRASYILAGMSVLWGIISVIMAAFQCKLPKPWDIGAHHCESMFVQWAVIETGNMVIELLIPGLIMMMIWNLQARLKAKIIVLLAFSLQLLVVIPTIFRLILLQQTTEQRRDDRTLTITETVIVTEVTMHFSLMAATFPCLRKFLQVFDMNMGATTHMTTELDPENDGSNESYRLKSLGRPSWGRRVSLEQWSRSHRQERKYQPHTVTTISADPTPGDGHGKVQRQRTIKMHDRGSVGSDYSQHAMITRTQQWEVKVESRDVEIDSQMEP